MVQLLLAFLFGSAALLLLIYAIVRRTQADDRPLSPVRLALLLGGMAGVVAVLAFIAWRAWVAAPG